MITKEVEKIGISKILSYLKETDLIDLVGTVTNRMITNFETKECIPLILNYSSDALQFLMKKKIKKEFIFRYLNEQHIYSNSCSTKSDLIRECLSYWGSSDNYESMEIEEIESEDDDVVPFVNKTIESNQISMGHVQEFSNQSIATSQIKESQLVNTTKQSISDLHTDDQLIELGLKFGEWFYKTLPLVNCADSFDVNNFWPDSHLRIQFEYGTNSYCCQESSSVGNLNLLKQLISSNIQLRPNLLPQFDGVRVNHEAHGLIKVMIRGILYYEDQPVGWFDNAIGLIPDATLDQHNWRIKIFDLLIKLSRPLPCIEHFFKSPTMIDQQ